MKCPKCKVEMRVKSVEKNLFAMCPECRGALKLSKDDLEGLVKRTGERDGVQGKTITVGRPPEAGGEI